jgi:hypothetical protein
VSYISDGSIQDKAIQEYAKSLGFANPDELIDNLIRSAGLGGKTTQFADAFLGYNHAKRGMLLHPNREIQGHVFIVRPDLNLSAGNLAADRRLTQLISAPENSYQRAIRTLLDPEGAFNEGITCPSLIDNNSPFMHIFANLLTNLDGWPDVAGNVYVRPEGTAKESWIMYDGYTKILSDYQLQLTFQNVDGDPISLAILTWLIVMDNTHIGTMVRRAPQAVRGEMDYTTCIYRMLTDASGRTVTKWARTGYAIPYGINLGQAFSYNIEELFHPAMDKITVPFHCVWAEYNDPATLSDFNRLGIMFNPRLARPKSGGLIEIGPEDAILFNYRGYPQVNVLDGRLSWYVDEVTYNAFTRGRKSVQVPR